LPPRSSFRDPVHEPGWSGDNPAMTLADDQQQRLLERLRQAGSRPLAFSELRHDGIHFPATVVGELEMRGYRIERVYKDGRMVACA
jgi:hypothetical protein